MATFCHFHTLIYHKMPYNAVILAKGISAATQRPKALDFKNLVHDFSEGVRISVPWHNPEGMQACFTSGNLSLESASEAGTF